MCLCLFVAKVLPRPRVFLFITPFRFWNSLSGRRIYILDSTTLLTFSWTCSKAYRSSHQDNVGKLSVSRFVFTKKNAVGNCTIFKFNLSVFKRFKVLNYSNYVPKNSLNHCPDMTLINAVIWWQNWHRKLARKLDLV